MTRTDNIRLSKEALKAAREMGVEAAKNDKWMEPCPEDHVDEVTDLGDLIQAHRDGWCETQHFQEHYRPRLEELSEQEEERLGRPFDDHVEAAVLRYEGIYIPLRDEFFEAWEETNGFANKANALLEEREKEKRRRDEKRGLYPQHEDPTN